MMTRLLLVKSADKWEPLGVVIVYGFDCTTFTPAQYKMNNVYWLVVEKLTYLVDTIGYIFVMSTPNTYRSDKKLVDSDETQKRATRKAPPGTGHLHQENGGWPQAHKLCGYRLILVFSVGSTHKGDFFDGAKDFHIKFHIRNKPDNFIWSLVAVYGAAQDEHKAAFLRKLVNLAKHNPHPILIGGDINMFIF